MRVGLLEDDTAIQEMLLLMLQEEGYTAVNFPGAEECIVALTNAAQSNASIPVDVMIVDWRLEGAINGTEVIRQIRSQPRLHALPIILTTAATFNDFQELKNLQVSLLEKPFSVDEILALIKKLTRQ